MAVVGLSGSALAHVATDHTALLRRDHLAVVGGVDDEGLRIAAARTSPGVLSAVAAALRERGSVAAGARIVGAPRQGANPPSLAPATQPTITAPTDGATVSSLVTVSATSTAGFVRLSFGPKDATVAVDAGTAAHEFDSWGMLGATTVSAADCSDAGGTDCGTPVTVSVIVSNAAPTLTQPSPGAHVRLSVTVGAETSATAVMFRIDGVEVAFDSVAPFVKAVSTDGLSLGEHQVDAVNCDAGHLCADGNPSASRTFTVQNRLSPTITRIAPNPFNPDGPDRVSSTTVRYHVDVDSTATLRVQNSGGDTVFGPVSLGTRHPGIAYTYRWSGRGTGGVQLRGGRYTIHLDTASTDNSNLLGHASGSVTIDTRPAQVSGGGATPRTVYPVRDQYKDTTTLHGRLSEPVASMRVQIRSAAGAVVRTIDAGRSPSGAFHIVWNGRSGAGAVVPAGRYAYRYLTRDRLGNAGQSKSFHLAVSAKRLVRKAWTSTVSAKQSFILNISGACSGVYAPTNRGWPGSVGYYSDYKCAGIDEDAVAAAVHGVRVPAAIRYGSVRVDTYGACSLPAIHDHAVLFYLDSGGDVSNVGFILNWRVGWHAGKGVSATNFIGRGGRMRWVTGTLDVNWYDVQSYRIRLAYYVLQ
jgi:flagellar hook assembly protein FlgD